MSQLSRIRNIGIIRNVYNKKRACVVQLYNINSRWSELVQAFAAHISCLNELKVISEIYGRISVPHYYCISMTNPNCINVTCDFHDNGSILRSTIETNNEIETTITVNQDSCNGRFMKNVKCLVEGSGRLFSRILQRLMYQQKPLNSILISKGICALWKLKQIAQCVYV